MSAIGTLQARATDLHAGEVNPDLRALLRHKEFELHGDALTHEGQYDRIIMNPPFEERADAIHVMRAYEKNLKPGGRLVAIMGEGPFFASDRTSATFRAWLKHVGGTDEKLPEGSFKDSDVSTMVNVRMVVIDKPVEVNERAKPTKPTKADVPATTLAGLIEGGRSAKLADPVRKGEVWRARKDGGYYSGTVTVLRVEKGYVAFDLEGHGLEEISEAEFHKYFARASAPSVTPGAAAPTAREEAAASALKAGAKAELRVDAKDAWANDLGIRKGSTLTLSSPVSGFPAGEMKVTAISKTALYIGPDRFPRADVEKALREGTMYADISADTLFDPKAPYDHDAGLTKMRAYPGKFVVARARMDSIKSAALANQGENLGVGMIAFPNTVDGRSAVRQLHMEFDKRASDEYNRRFAAPVEDIGGGLFGGDAPTMKKAPIGAKGEEFAQGGLFGGDDDAPGSLFDPRSGQTGGSGKGKANSGGAPGRIGGAAGQGRPDPHHHRGPGTLRAATLKQELSRAGRISLAGQDGSTPQKLAEIAQVLRDPRIETLRYFITDRNGVIAHERAISSRMPGVVPLSPATHSRDEWILELRKELKKWHGGRLWLMHNHPSGDASPSPEDIALTRTFGMEFGQEFGGHVVIDHDHYSTIDGSGSVTRGKVKSPKSRPAIPSPVLGTQVSSAGDLARLATQFVHSPDTAAIIGLSSKLKVRAVLELAISEVHRLAANPTRAAAFLSNLARRNGLALSALVVRDLADVAAHESKLISAIDADLLVDVLDVSGRSYVLQGKKNSTWPKVYRLGRDVASVQAMRVLERRLQYGALFPRQRKVSGKVTVPEGDYSTATQVGLLIYRSGKTSLNDFRAEAVKKIGGWIEKESGLLWRTVRKMDIEEPAALGEHLKTATRPTRDKSIMDWVSEAFFTTGHRAAQARGHLETVWGMKKGALVGSAEDIEAAINRMTRLGGKIESTVLRGFMDENGNRITKGLPEIQSDLKKAKVDVEDFQVFMRAMRENSISRRPGNVAIGPERVMSNEMVIEKFREKYKGKESIISRAAQDFMDFADAHLRMFEDYGLRGEGWADDIREMNPVYWPLYEAQTWEDLAMRDVAPGARGTGEIDLKQVKGGKKYADGWAMMAQQVERVIRAGEMSKAFTPFLEEASKHPLMQWIAKDITDEVETKRMLEKQRRMGIVTEQEMNALDGDVQAQKDLDEMMAQMLADVDLNKDAIIVTYKDGEKRYWTMDPYLWAATKGAAPEQFNGVLQVLRFFGGLNRGLTTKHNPLFAFVFNPMIDVVSATSQHGMNPLQFFKGLYHSARGEKSALYRKALQNEVFFNSRGMRDFLEQQWVFEGGEKSTAIRALADKLLAMKGVEFVNRASQTMEEATRLGMFAQMEKAYRKRGLSPEEATRRASDDSANLMNFGEAGGMGRSFSRWGVPFANVTSQVIMSAYRGYRRSPGKFLLRLVALITIPKLIEYFLYKDDDEYKRMPNYAKDGTLMFKRGPGDWLAIRIPQELGMVFAGIPRRALEAKAGTKTAGEAVGDQASELAQMLMPRALPTLGASALQATTYMAFGRTYDLRFGVREQYGDNKGYEQAKQQAATLLGSLGKFGAEYAGYFTGLEKEPPALMQRFAPRPGRPRINVEGPARAEWLSLRNPNSFPGKKKDETDEQFARRVKAESAKVRSIIESKMKSSGWNKKSDDEKRRALAKAGATGIKSD